MRQEKKPANAQEQASEIKTRIPVWLYPTTLAVMERAMAQDNCKSRSEFLEKAALFYAGYVSGQDACDYLPPALVRAIQSAVRGMDDRVARLLYSQSVELDMLMNVVAAGMEVDDETLRELRKRCVQNVRKNGGNIRFEDAVRYQRGE